MCCSVSERMVLTLGNIQSSCSLQVTRVLHSVSANHLHHSRSAPACRTTSSEIDVLRKRLSPQMKSQVFGPQQVACNLLEIPETSRRWLCLDLATHFTGFPKCARSKAKYDNLMTKLLYLESAPKSNETSFSLNASSFSSTLKPGVVNGFALLLSSPKSLSTSSVCLMYGSILTYRLPSESFPTDTVRFNNSA